MSKRAVVTNKSAASQHIQVHGICPIGYFEGSVHKGYKTTAFQF